MLGFILLSQRTEERCLRCDTVEQGLKVKQTAPDAENILTQ